MGILEGAAAVLAGYLIGRFMPGRRHFKVKGPICHCKHAVNYHRDKDGCQHPSGLFRDDTCSCRKYVGPEPLPEYI